MACTFSCDGYCGLLEGGGFTIAELEQLDRGGWVENEEGGVEEISTGRVIPFRKSSADFAELDQYIADLLATANMDGTVVF